MQLSQALSATVDRDDNRNFDSFDFRAQRGADLRYGKLYIRLVHWPPRSNCDIVAEASRHGRDSRLRAGHTVPSARQTLAGPVACLIYLQQPLSKFKQNINMSAPIPNIIKINNKAPLARASI